VVAKEAAPAKRRRSFKETHELEKLTKNIARLDADIAKLHEEMAQPNFDQQPASKIAAKSTKLKDLEAQLATAYARWEELEQLEA
jgi:ATP-binding cassette subfamily F protein uup